MKKSAKLRKLYQYSSMPERIPLSLKNKTLKLLSSGKNGCGLTVRNAAYIKTRGKHFKKNIIRTGRRQIESSTIPSSDSYSLRTCLAEQVIEDISKKHYYTFDNIMVILDPYDYAPLTALAVFYTKEECRVSYTVMGKDIRTDYSAAINAACEHRIPILGLYPGCKNQVELRLIDASGMEIKKRTIEITAKKLPDDLKEIIHCNKHKAKSAYDMIMITGGLHIKTLAFDENGDIRYFLKRKNKPYGIFPLSNGRFIYTEKDIGVPCYSVPQACMMYEMDYLGRVYKTYFYEKGFHHCACEMEANGNLLLGSSSMDGYGENTVIEMERKTGEIVKTLCLNDYFREPCNNNPGYIHLNSVSYFPAGKSIIVCMRNIHTIAKFNWETKELIWVFAHPEAFKGTAVENKVLKPKGIVKWCFQQHAAYKLNEISEDMPFILKLIVYDNHTDKRTPVDWYDGDDKHSFISIFTINEKEMTVSQHHITKVKCSESRSNALLDYKKGRIFNMAGRLLPAKDDNRGMIEEYDYTSNTLLNQYYVKPGFFAAYEFSPDLNALSLPMEIDLDYWKGSTLSMSPYIGELNIKNARTPVNRQKIKSLIIKNEQQDEKDCEEKTQERDVEFYFQEDLFLAGAKDHTLFYIYLKGKHTTYYANLLGTYQTMDFMKDRSYKIPFWIKSLPGDTYHIYYNYLGDLYDSGEEFTIS